MGVDANSTVEGINDRGGYDNELQNPAGDIENGVERELDKNPQSYTLFLDVAGAVDVTVELSPNGEDWFEPTDSPIKFSAAGTEIVHFDYDFNHIRLAGSDATNVLALDREVL